MPGNLEFQQLIDAGFGILGNQARGSSVGDYADTSGFVERMQVLIVGPGDGIYWYKVHGSSVVDYKDTSGFL